MADPTNGAEQTPQWLRDVLTELSAYAHGYMPSPPNARLLLTRVPSKHLADSGLTPRVTFTDKTLEQVLGHDDPAGTCTVCVAFRAEMEAIAENERQARRG